MGTFERYSHISRLDTPETDGILSGECYIFPKLDGTNASVWRDDDGKIQAGSRNRQLSESADNAGFRAHILEDENIIAFFGKYPDWRLYGEWLVPHTIKYYRPDTWNQFYVFDVMDEEGNAIPFSEYSVILDEENIEYIPPLACIYRPTVEQVVELVDRNTYLMQDGGLLGEGVVVKNYGWKNRFGRECHAKFVRSEFKDKAMKLYATKVTQGERQAEFDVADLYVTAALVHKERAKILLDDPEIERKSLIPRLLEQVYYSIVTEEMWNIQKMKGVKVIDFRKLRQACAAVTKTHAADLF